MHADEPPQEIERWKSAERVSLPGTGNYLYTVCKHALVQWYCRCNYIPAARSFFLSLPLSLSRREERNAYREPNNSDTKLTVFRTDSPLTRGHEGYVCKTVHGWRNAIIIVASHEEEKYPMTPAEGKKSRVPWRRKRERDRETRNNKKDRWTRWRKSIRSCVIISRSSA